MDYKIKNTIGRNTEVCFYDVTNQYFEIEQNDEDILDETDAVIREGLRKKGPSKEKEPELIVQMGLFIDDNGIQIVPWEQSIPDCIAPGLKKAQTGSILKRSSSLPTVVLTAIRALPISFQKAIDTYLQKARKIAQRV